MKKYATFALWAADQDPRHKKLISALRRLMKKTAPKLTESVKWGNGVWLGKEWPVVFLYAGADDHVQFGFFGGASLEDPKKLLRGRGKYVRHIRVERLTDIDAPAFAKLIRQAVKAERE